MNSCSNVSKQMRANLSSGWYLLQHRPLWHSVGAYFHWLINEGRYADLRSDYTNSVCHNMQDQKRLP